MRAIIQKVNNASVVTMDEMMITAIGAGLVVWVGMRRMDRKADIDFIVKQILNFQIYDKDEKTKWSQTVVDKDYEILCLSEVTLYCNTKGPFKPTFYNAMDSDSAKIFFTSFVNELKQTYKPNKVRRGRYGMSSFVNAQFVGPVFSIQSPREAVPTIGPLQRSPLKQSGPGFSQFGEHGQPTRTIPRGVGKFYGQKDYNWQYQQNQQGYNQETYNQPMHEHYQQPYEQYPYGQQANQDYGQHNVYNPQTNVQGSYGGQVYEETAVHKTVTLGLCLMVAFAKNDSLEDLNHMVKKVLKLRAFNENVSEKPWSMNIVQKGYGIMVLLQPELFSHFNGYTPEFSDSMELRYAIKFFKMFIRMLKKAHRPELIKASNFKIQKRPMKAQVIHNGPIMFTLHSPKQMVRSPIEKFIKAYGLDWYVLEGDVDKHLKD